MRITTRRVCQAFVDGRADANGNGSTDGNALLLFGNTIARRIPAGADYPNMSVVEVTLAGWPTPTTRRWLNGLCELLGLSQRFHQYRKCQFYGDQPIGKTDTFVLTEIDGGRAMVKSS